MNWVKHLSSEYFSCNNQINPIVFDSRLISYRQSDIAFFSQIDVLCVSKRLEWYHNWSANLILKDYSLPDSLQFFEYMNTNDSRI